MLATRGCLPFMRVEPLEWKYKTRKGKSVRRRILSWLPLRIERDLVALFLNGVRTGIFCDHTVSSVLYQRNSFGSDRGRKRHFAAARCLWPLESQGVSPRHGDGRLPGLHTRIDIEREGLFR